MALIEVRLRPTGPWRTGYRGDRERVDVVYHSDTLFSAVTHAMRALGWMEEWLAATVGATGEPAVRLGSLFPFVGKTRLIAPPQSVWPPAGRGQLHLSGANLVPLEVLRQGIQDEARWEVDGECQCLLPANGTAPFRIVVRESAAVDRLTGVAEGHKTACLEFAPNSGFWGVFSAADKVWESRVKSALRLLADSGFGGERSRGWGRSAEPQFNDASHLFPAASEDTAAWWLLSLYSPDASDAVDWTKSQSSVTVRGGWTDSSAGVGLKKQVRLVEEGSVLAAPGLRGRAVDVAPEGFAHPVYRAGFALAVPVPVPAETASKKKPVKEEPKAEVVVTEHEVVPVVEVAEVAEPVVLELVEVGAAEVPVSEAVEPVVAESTFVEPVAADVVVVEPAAADAVVAEPTVAEPTVADAVEPAAVEPTAAEPSVADAVVTETAAAEPFVAAAVLAEAVVAEAAVAESGVTPVTLTESVASGPVAAEVPAATPEPPTEVVEEVQA